MRYVMIVGLFALAGSAAAQSPGIPLPQRGSDDKSEKLICRRETPVGSLIQSKKTCLTRAEWEQLGEQGSNLAQAILESGLSKGSRGD